LLKAKILRNSKIKTTKFKQRLDKFKMFYSLVVRLNLRVNAATKREAKQQTA
jgi:hypothetical protein